MEPSHQVVTLSERSAVDSFSSRIGELGLSPLTAEEITILQINITRQCNLQCRHCHVEAGPRRTEMMNRDTLEQCLRIVEAHDISTVDITGGAPELHPELPWFLEHVTQLGRRSIVRSNLVILREPKCTPYLDLFARLGVELVGSVPDYRQDRSDRQRGKGMFAQAIEAIRELNGLGYGQQGSGLILDLVHNPSGAYLPATQASLEREYRVHLPQEHGIVFNHLFCLTNCPVGRYLDFLVRSDNLEEYMSTLRQAFNPAVVRNLMCRILLSIGWDGRLYDCDFNQMLGLTVNSGAPAHIRDFDFEILRRREITVRDHCFACTAGAGSSCQGALISA